MVTSGEACKIFNIDYEVFKKLRLKSIQVQASCPKKLSNESRSAEYLSNHLKAKDPMKSYYYLF